MRFNFLFIVTILLQTLFLGFIEGSPHSFTLRRNEGRTISTNRSYITLESYSFLPKSPNKLLFTNFRLHGTDNREFAVNAGAGVRFGEPSDKRIYGLNVFWDFRRSHHSAFNQLGFGFEALGRRFSCRINGYIQLPQKSHLYAFCLCDQYIGNFFVLHEKFIGNMGGFDIDVEAILKRFEGGDFRFAITPYYFNINKGCTQNAVGSQFRFTTHFKNYFTFAILASHDSMFKGRLQARLGVTVPFDFTSKSSVAMHPNYLNERMYDPVQRQELIILKKRQKWTWNF